MFDLDVDVNVPTETSYHVEEILMEHLTLYEVHLALFIPDNFAKK